MFDFIRARSQSLGAAVLATALLLPGAGFAQGDATSPPASPAFAPPAGDAYTDLSLSDLLGLKLSVASIQGKTRFETPSTVSVIDRETIERFNFQTLMEALETVAGMDIQRTSSRLDMPTSRGILQAHYPNKVLLMIDGIPAWMPVTGELTLGRIDIALVDHIEILRGPASVLYGTNAYSGAINVVLRKPKDADGTSGMVGAGLGTYYALRSNGIVAMREGKLSVTAGGGYSSEEGSLQEHLDSAGQYGHYRDFRNPESMFMNVEYANHRVLLNAYRERQTKLGNDPTYAAGWGDPQTLWGTLVDYGYRANVTDKVLLRADAHYDWNGKTFSREKGMNVRSDVKGWRAGGNAALNAKLMPWFSLEGGVDFDYRVSAMYRNYRAIEAQTISDCNLLDKRAYEYAGFAQGEFTWGPLSALAGTRLTKNEFYGANLSSRGTVVYAINKTNSLKLIAGQSFRAPSLFEVNFLNTPGRTTSGNPDVKPETSTSFELAYLTAVGNLFGQALVYYATYDNLLYRQPYTKDEPVTLADGDLSTKNVVRYENGKAFHALGAELELNYRGKHFDAFSSYTLILGDSGDRMDANKDHYNFKYIPKHKYSGGVGLNYAGFFVSGVVNVRSTVNGPSVLTNGAWVQSGKIDSELAVDANVGYRTAIRGKKMRHVVSVKNLTNASLEGPEYVDLAMKSIPGWRESRRISYTFTLDF
jgi:outer membrane receptor protein involved in Fe transport